MAGSGRDGAGIVRDAAAGPAGAFREGAPDARGSAPARRVAHWPRAVQYGNMGRVTILTPPAMKTTLDIDDELLRRARQAALERDTTLRAIVEEALARALGPTAAPVPIRTVVWPPIETGGPAAPIEDERDWLARIKAVRYGDASGGATGKAGRPTGDDRPRAPKRRTR
jgi:hypothetical protein